MRQPAAKGVYRREYTDPDTGERRVKEFPVPAIFSPEEWDAIQAKLARHARAKGGRPGNYACLLRKLATCGTCGAMMVTAKGGSPGKVIRYYRCGTPGCGKWHNLVATDARVAKKVRGFVERPGTLAVTTAGGADAETRKSDVAEAERELALLDRQVVNLARMVSQEQIDQKVADTLLGENKRKRQDAEGRRERAKVAIATAEAARARAGDVEARLGVLRRNLDWPEAMAELVKLIFGERGAIRIFPDGRIELRGEISLGADLPDTFPGASSASRRARRA